MRCSSLLCSSLLGLVAALAGACTADARGGHPTGGPLGSGKADQLVSPTAGCTTTPLAQGEGSPRDVGVDAERLYWLALVNDRIEVHSMPRGGGEVSVVVKTGWLQMSRLVIDRDPQGYVYLLGVWGDLARVAKGGGALEMLWEPPESDWVHGDSMTLVGGDDLYFTTQQSNALGSPMRLRRHILGGAPGSSVVSEPGGLIGSLHASGDQGYFELEVDGVGAQLGRVSRGDVELLHPLPTASSFVVAGDHAYVTGGRGDGNALYDMDLESGEMRQLYTGDDAERSFLYLAVDQSYLYWEAVEFRRDDQVYRMPIGGGAPALLVEAINVGSVTPVDGELYWTQLYLNDGGARSDGRVLVTRCAPAAGN